MDLRQSTQNKWSKEQKKSLHPIRRPACDKYAKNNIIIMFTTLLSNISLTKVQVYDEAG